MINIYIATYFENNSMQVLCNLDYVSSPFHTELKLNKYYFNLLLATL